MRITTLFVLWLGAATGFAGETKTWNFDQDPSGGQPTGFLSARTGRGPEGKWVIEAVPDAPSKPNAVKQASSDDTSYRFPVLVATRPEVKDGAVAVRFRAISGRVDQAGGLVWRYLDENNYYVVRANALEDNVVLYKVEKGKRSSIAPKGTPPRTYGVGHEVPPQTWNSLRVTFQGPLFAVYFDGEKLFEVEDSTFTGEGKVGLWTKADSVTFFDDLELEIQSIQ
ncbi:MAG: hypothetical protein ACE5JI_23080 [Acidobacteriota bacterium]